MVLPGKIGVVRFVQPIVQDVVEIRWYRYDPEEGKAWVARTVLDWEEVIPGAVTEPTLSFPGLEEIEDNIMIGRNRFEHLCAELGHTLGEVRELLKREV